ncbi:hypothetical protein [Pseudoalteromonas sp. HL-AS2]
MKLKSLSSIHYRNQALLAA